MNYVDCTYNIADKFLWGGLFNYINALLYGCLTGKIFF